MPEDLYQIVPRRPTEDKKIAGVRIAAEPLLNLERQPVHASPHVGHAAREPDAQSGGNRDHARRSSTSENPSSKPRRRNPAPPTILRAARQHDLHATHGGSR